jgi:hypothetical protein
MPTRIGVGLTVCLVLVGLTLAITGLRMIVASNALGWLFTLVGFLLLVTSPTLVSRLGRPDKGPKS